MAKLKKVSIRHQLQLICSQSVQAHGVKQTGGMRMLGKLTMKKIRGDLRHGVGAEELPIKIILLSLAELAQAGVRVLIKCTACC